MTSDPRHPGSGDNATSDETKLSPPTPKDPAAGWLSSSGSIDHGRFPPGTTLVGRYRVIGLLGKGGMGEVYRADDLRLGQQVALKFLPEGLGRDPIKLAQFHNEVRTARQVSHPNVCRVYDIGDADGHLFLSMEYVDGEDLSSLLRRIGRLPEDKALEIARQICAGLAAAHERGVLHRDLKPANIMIDGAGRARIMDFGLASVGVVTDVLSGTPAYMAPEQLAGKSVSVKSDIYALGLVLYELFTGKRAFDAKSLTDLMAQHASGSITTPTSVVKTLDATIERAILRCLDHDPARRPASALAVAASLPGGDPLAAALAAGETPSPEMVAAAGGESAAIGPAAGVFWLAATAALLVAVAALADRTSLLARVPLAKPVAVLVDRAEDVRRTLGYADTPGDVASGFSYADDYLEWGVAHGRGETNWKELADGRPAGLVFTYRTSSEPLLPYNRLAVADLEDPPFVKTGMTEMTLDTKGRLISFFALAPQAEQPSAAPPAADYRAAFAAASLDMAAFKQTAPSRTPPGYADERRAWTGVLPDNGTPITIEAASYRGRTTAFEVVAPWTRASRDPDPKRAGGSRTSGSSALILVLLATAVVLARRNMRSGRADRQGAFRIGAVLFLVFGLDWLVEPHVPSLGEETSRLFVFIGIGLFIALVMYLVYLAIEPFVRRSWPTMLVGWSRALSGRVRDPLIGRDLLVGVMFGLALQAIDSLNVWIPSLLHWPDSSLAQPSTGALEHFRYFILTVNNALNNGLQNALLSVLVFTLFREGVKRALGRITLARFANDYTVAAVAVVAVASFRMFDSGLDAHRLWLPAAYYLSTTAVLVIVLLRFGLLATVVMSIVGVLTNLMPLTLNSSSLYAGTSWLTLGLLFAMAAIGVWFARAGEPLFGAPAGGAGTGLASAS